MGERPSSVARTPAKTPSTLKRQPSSSAGTQKTIVQFFSKSANASSRSTPKPTASAPDSSPCLRESTRTNTLPKAPQPSSMTPVPSSDAIEPASSQENMVTSSVKVAADDALTSPSTPAETVTPQISSFRPPLPSSSPTRKSRKPINYAEPSDDEDDDPFVRLRASGTRRRTKTVATIVDDGDDYEDAGSNGAADEDDGWFSSTSFSKHNLISHPAMLDFVVSDESDTPSQSKKRKRREPTKAAQSRKKSNVSSPIKEEQYDDDDIDEAMLDIPTTSTAQQWRYDPDSAAPTTTRAAVTPTVRRPAAPKGKEKAHIKEPEDRYPWLANIVDINKKPPNDPDHDPSTVYIPPMAWNKFSPFEKQYWEIKQNLWDTVVFFKKGKFYELYENDATIGHQLFDLKLTDRVNMRMVGVPESSLDMWVNQFVAKGYKVARVDQMESALGKEMRERDDTSAKNKKADKIIRRELACILTGGTLVDGSMLQDDLATYCASIKESTIDDKPAFGITFVDCATGQFFISEFEDDADLTKFETFVAQTSPRELILEKSQISTKALRILKNNTSPMTIWNYLKKGSEFWDADVSRRELDHSGYFAKEDGGDEVWPETLAQARDKDLLMSAFGALIQYLRVLKLEGDLLSQGNFEWYSPIRRNGTLILDGQTLINLEVFSNTVNGGPEGTLFTLLNRCVTPFGKRLFRQWVCHPLCDTKKINERLDAVDMLNSDRGVREQFTSQMTKMPDLERLISRIHAASCKPEDFVRVLEGFEQIEYTMGLLSSFGGGNSLVDRLLTSMPNLSEPLSYWKTAFDRKKAKDEKIFIPERRIEHDFDNSQDHIEEIKHELQTLLGKKKLELKCKTLKFTDVGKEIYQIEAPKAVKVPSNWRQMSATSSVKRYYFEELTELVRELQEAEETHSQIVKEVAERFFRRFDADYETWSQSIRIISQLDCLISLAKASSSLGEPSCRPQFVDQERSVVEFEELRHPCMLNAVADFIPNDVQLGGGSAKINLLTGANAAGKSTVLRMSTFFVELSETKKILSEATPRSLVILDELGRGTSSYDGVAVAQAVLHHIATHVGCVGFFATHYHSLATEFENHPEIRPRRMQIHVDEEQRRVTFLYKLEDGVAEGSFGMHCAAMCGISSRIIGRAEVAAKEWEHTSRLKESLEKAKSGCYIPLGILSDVSSLLKGGDEMKKSGVEVLLRAIEVL
ncbi:DNA mismatch repair protein msh6 [Colletotrichum liriopes]|uniref:DNA mismatch repair protein n=1 Tax=Colletotrichum liriopes TaxID=708192 RepID=A0AA37GNU7_9PEZI|nr:DNA mismatch repair protein msh6 [Colletotrichum liriopes]